MAISVAFMAEILFPLMAVSSGIRLKIDPFRVVKVSTLYAVFGALTALGVFWLFGNGAGEDISRTIDQMTGLLASGGGYGNTLGMSGAELNDAFSQAVQLMPSSFFFWGALVTYIEYAIISRIKRARGGDVRPMSPVREFNLGRNAIMGWCGLCIVGMLISYASDAAYIQSIYGNIYSLFRLVFAFQGISFIAYACHMKGWPKAIWVIAAIILMLTNYGILFLYVLGLIDGVVGLKGRINKKR